METILFLLFIGFFSAFVDSIAGGGGLISVPALLSTGLPPQIVSHASLKVGESELMFSDTFPGQPHQSGNQVTICISTDDAEKSRKMFDALKEGGTVTMPLQETFFSPAYGSVIDQFGITFQIFTEGEH